MEMDRSPKIGKPRIFEFRETIAFGHTFVLLSIFLPVIVFCAILGQNSDCVYFAGRKVWLLAIFLPALFLSFPLIHVYMVPKRSTALIIPSVWIPCIVIGGIMFWYDVKLKQAEHMLLSRDCFAFDNKRELVRAYQVAEQIYDSCVLRPGLEMEGVSVRNCPLYKAAQEKWAPEFRYLESLEQRFHCAGLCRSRTGKRLWENAGTEAPSCSLYVAQWIHGASVQTGIALWYIAFVALITIPLHFTVLVPLVHSLEQKKFGLGDA